MQSEGDRFLIEEIQRGSAEAFRRLVDRFGGRLKAFATRQLEGSGLDPEDAVQETFLSLLRNLDRTDEIRTLAYGELTPERFDDIHLLSPPAESAEGNLIDRIVTEGWRAVADEAEIDVSPPTDDRPFAAQMGLWRNFSWEALGKVNGLAEFRGFPLSITIIVVVLGVVTADLVAVPVVLAGIAAAGGPLCLGLSALAAVDHLELSGHSRGLDRLARSGLAERLLRADDLSGPASGEGPADPRDAR